MTGLDRDVGIEVMGWKFIYECTINGIKQLYPEGALWDPKDGEPNNPRPGGHSRHCNFSSDWIEVEQVVKRVLDQGFHVSVISPGLATDGVKLDKFRKWSVEIQKVIESKQPLRAKGSGEGETLPLALCRAALRAIRDAGMRCSLLD